MVRHYRSDLWFVFCFVYVEDIVSPGRVVLHLSIQKFHLKDRFTVDYNVQIDEFLVSSRLKFQQW